MTQSNWKFAFASAIGNSHIDSGIPCQDACGVEDYGEYTICVVSDGAGSQPNSHFGSAQVVKECLYQFHLAIKSTSWSIRGVMPNVDQWHKIAKRTLCSVKDSLSNYSLSQEIEFKSLACTVIVVVTLKNGLLVTHIGDGRAGFCNRDDQWIAAIKPFHGEEANETVFLTSDIWTEEIIDNYIESRVIEDDIKAICLLSDGCEKAAFECNLYDPLSERYYDPNTPFPPFFKSNVEIIPKLRGQGLTQDEINDNWRQFLMSGNEKLKTESDDKTLILGVKVKEDEGSYA